MLLCFIGCRLCLGHVTGLRFWNFPGLLESYVPTGGDSYWCLLPTCCHVGWMQAVLRNNEEAAYVGPN